MNIFTSKDIQFGNLIDSIQRYLNNTVGSAWLNASSVFGQLIGVISAVGHNIMSYIEDSLVEQNKYTAQRKKSILGLAALSGYQPSQGKAACVMLRIAHKASNVGRTNVVLPNRYQLCCTQNGLYYSLSSPNGDTVVTRGSGSFNIVLKAAQGRYENQRFIAKGGDLETFLLAHTGMIDEDYFIVRVNGNICTKEASLYDLRSSSDITDRPYYLRYNPTGKGIDICFGNDTHGRVLTKGDIVTVEYLVHDGEAGNITYNSDVRFLFMDPLKDTHGEEVDGNAIFDVSLASPNAVTSGSNAEDIKQVREMIGFNSRSLVLAHPDNYHRFLSHYSFVGYNRTWCEPGSMVIRSLVMRNYKQHMNTGSDYFSLKESDFHLTDQQKDGIKNAIEASGSQLAGSIYDICDMDLAKYALFIYVNLKSGDKKSIEAQIRSRVGNFFTNIQSDSYIPKSDIIADLKENIPGIDGINCYFLSQKNEEAQYKGEYIDIQRKYNAASGTYTETQERVYVMPGTNPQLGLDQYGNILIDKDFEFPVLMGGWRWRTSDDQEVDVQDPLTVTFE